MSGTFPGNAAAAASPGATGRPRTRGAGVVIRVPCIVLCAAFTLATPPAAQERAWSVDASLGVGPDAGRGALSAWREVLKAPLKARLSAGLRASLYVAMSSAFENRDAVQDELQSRLDIDPGVAGANVAVGVELPLGPVVLGANLDLLGIAAGSRWTRAALEGTPETLSYFLYGSADRGALNSEYYVLIGLRPSLALRIGASHYVTNYLVTNTTASGRPRARYQRFETVPFAALRLRL
jgi:hypothetical protein